MKLIIHIDEIDKWNLVVGNAVNAKAVKANSEIEIIVHGTAIVVLKEKVAENFGLKDKLISLNEKNIKIKCCNNAFNKFDMKKSELLSFVEIVPAAIVEIMEKQQNDGFAYVKP